MTPAGCDNGAVRPAKRDDSGDPVAVWNRGVDPDKLIWTGDASPLPTGDLLLVTGDAVVEGCERLLASSAFRSGYTVAR